MLFSWYYNLDAHVCVHPMDDELIYTPEDIMALTYDREGHVFKWKLMRRVQELDLTIEETAIATALCVMNAGMENAQRKFQKVVLRIWMSFNLKSKGSSI